MTKAKRKFRAELSQVMDIIIHSLYSHREIFVRELVSNACDAIDRLRFDALQHPELIGSGSEWSIRIAANRQEKTLRIIDNGIGMSREGVAENLGTIARSGTKNFLAQLQEADARERPELIGQFGVGFYSAFMVAEKVTVLTSPADDPTAGVRWECDGGEGYTIEDIAREMRGTEIILHLREDAEEFLDEWRLREIVKKYSDFVAYPISLELIDDKGEPVEVKDPVMNSMKAIWIRPKSEVTQEEYNEFYKAISHDFEDPLHTIHYAAEGTLEFKALLFLPGHRPFDFFMGDQTKTGPSLYVQRVQIMDHCDKLLPMYMRFVKGVVDSSDLPLNVSRELLQQNAVLAKIRKNLVGKLLGEMAALKDKQYEEYLKLYQAFGDVLKEGVNEDFANREKVADLLLFHSTGADEEDKYVTLEQYVSAMGEEQKEIYYLSGEQLETLKASPYLESFRAKGQEVLLLTSPIDEWVMESLREYKGKTFQAIDRGEIEGSDEEKKIVEDNRERYAALLEYLNGRLDEVKEVRLSARLKDSAACLVVEGHGMTAQMERLMKKMGQDVPASERILELNPQNPAVEHLLALYEKDRSDERVEKFGRLFYDQAVIAEGSRITDPAAFARRINELIAGTGE
jgi:molecular chaperone HtpG